MPRRQARGHKLKADGSKLTAYSLHTGSIPSQSAVSIPYGQSSQNRLAELRTKATLSSVQGACAVLVQQDAELEGIHVFAVAHRCEEIGIPVDRVTLLLAHHAGDDECKGEEI